MAFNGTAAPADRTKVPSTTELLARIAELEQRLTAKQNITFKVSEKGAVSIYGLQRFPVTLYAEQWERILARAEELKGFLATNKPRLATMLRTTHRQATLTP